MRKVYGLRGLRGMISCLKCVAVGGGSTFSLLSSQKMSGRSARQGLCSIRFAKAMCVGESSGHVWRAVVHPES
jgi:hypothetical protein